MNSERPRGEVVALVTERANRRRSTMALMGYLKEYADWLRAADRPQTTIELRCYHIRRLGQSLDPLQATTQDLIEWLSSHEWATTTRRSYQSSLRSFYRWALATERVPTDPTVALPIVKARSGMPRPAAEDIVAAAIATASPRVRLMLRLGANAGLRRGEIAQVHTSDLTQDLDGWSLRIRGKGRRERLVPLTRILALELRSIPPGWAFPSPAGGHLTAAHVGKLMSRALGIGVTPHQLRHRFATRAFAVDNDLLTVQQLLGHSKPETTAIYTQLPAGAKRRLVDMVA